MEPRGSSPAAGDPPTAITNPVTGVTIRAADADGYDARVELPPGASGPPEHVHPTVEERFTVVEGPVRFRVDGRERTLPAGETVWVSPGTAHTFANPVGGPRETGDPTGAVLGVTTVPESERLAATVATLFGLAREGRTDDRGRPGLLQGAVMAEAVPETRLAGVPAGLQRALGATLGPVGRALGYEATYDRHRRAAYWRGEE
jgi:mannose-6-phosphate isomerase-like protein (cupin superfamily)